MLASHLLPAGMFITGCRGRLQSDFEVGIFTLHINSFLSGLFPAQKGLLMRAPFPCECQWKRSICWGGRQEKIGTIMKLDSKGEVFCRNCAATGLMINSNLQRRGKNSDLPWRRDCFPLLFLFFFSELVISLPDLKNNASNERASSVVLPGKSENDERKVQLRSNHAKSLCHGKRPSMAQDCLGNYAHCEHGFPGCNKLAKLQLFDIWMCNLGPAQPAAGYGVALEITPWMSCSLWTVSSLWMANCEQSALAAKGRDGADFSEHARLWFSSQRNPNPFIAHSPCVGHE